MPLEDIRSVWDFEKIEKRGGPDLATRCWYCGWCNSTFQGGWNATKAMLHCARVAGNNDVKSCVGPIPIDTLAIFRGFRMRKISMKGVKRHIRTQLLRTRRVLLFLLKMEGSGIPPHRVPGVSLICRGFEFDPTDHCYCGICLLQGLVVFGN